uniref:Uncharacterized protein n=1 Tax=Arundo donax TaxID=35708 RepID=A0A0A9A8B1_ARUDO
MLLPLNSLEFYGFRFGFVVRFAHGSDQDLGFHPPNCKEFSSLSSSFMVKMTSFFTNSCTKV